MLLLTVAGTAVAQGPAISHVGAVNIDDSTADIIWTTNVTADSRVNYGNTTALGLTEYDSSPVTSHSVTLTGLSPATVYYYEVTSEDGGGNSTVENNSGAYYTFSTLAGMELEGWIWTANSGSVVQASFSGLTSMVERSHTERSFSMHATGNLTVHYPAGDEVIQLDLYGNRARSLFYLRQEVTGTSASFAGAWLDDGTGGCYVSLSGMLILPNPGGQGLKSAKVCFVALRTPGVDVPLAEPGSFVETIDSLLTRMVKLVDRVLGSLTGVGFRDLLSSILTKVAVLVSALRNLGTPYIS
ncbi:MAG: fibronectin type III domain-containing protein [Dehalococcoidia bacterium]|nr:fibronectin type III domain-containing protein [Dehalococcoidia bacterium]